MKIQLGVRLKIGTERERHFSDAQLTRAANMAGIYRIRHGVDHPNAETQILRWRNPGRRGELASWREGNQHDAWVTLAKPLLSMLEAGL